MATVWIPSLMRNLTGEREQVDVPGKTVGEVIKVLDAIYPGIKSRLCKAEQIDPPDDSPLNFSNEYWKMPSLDSRKGSEEKNPGSCENTKKKENEEKGLLRKGSQPFEANTGKDDD